MKSIQKQKRSGGKLCAWVIYKDGSGKCLSDFKSNVTTNSGRDKLHDVGYISTSLSGSGFNYIASTEDTTQTINASQTTLTGEITNGNGLARSQATTRNHTNGTNSSLIERTSTISGAGYTDVTRSALFNASSSGTMGHLAAYSNGNSGVLVSGDTLKESWTINLG